MFNLTDINPVLRYFEYTLKTILSLFQWNLYATSTFPLGYYTKFSFISNQDRSRISAVVTRLRAGQSAVRIPVTERDFVFCKTSRPETTGPPSEGVPGSFQGVKRPGRESSHSHLSSA